MNNLQCKVYFFNLIKLTAVLLFIFAVNGEADEKIKKIVMAGPFASVSHPMLRIIESNALADVAEKVEFRLWKDPDQLRALVLKGDVDFVAVPTNVAANLYNKKVPLKLLNVSVWGILGILTRDKNAKTLKDLLGQEIVVPFRSDMPDIVLTQLIKKQGLDPKKDFKLRYVASPLDAMQMLIMRRSEHALLAEPAISMALRKTGSYPLKLLAPDLYRGADLQQEWAAAYHTDNNVPQAGVAVIGKHLNNNKVIKRFLQEYDKALSWYLKNPEAAGKLVEKEFSMLDAQAVTDSISRVNLKQVTAAAAQQKLEFFFDILYQSNPKVIGGKLPDAGFYYPNNPSAAITQMQ